MISKVLSRIFVIFFVLLFSQLPLFIEQYIIRLEGHLAESNHQIMIFQEAASANKKSLNEYISKFLEQTDSDFKAQGTIMQNAITRNQFLASAQKSLRSANPLLRPVIFIKYVDSAIAADAWKTFTLSLSLTFDVGVWALIGLVVGWVCLLALRGLWQRPQSPPQGKIGAS